MTRFWAIGTTAILALVSAAPVRAEPFTNESVIALSKAGVGNAVLLAKVNGLPCAYDVSTPGILALKGAGVANPVIAAMVDRCTGSTRAQGVTNDADGPLVKRTPGLYVSLRAGGRTELHVIRPTLVGGVRVTGNGSVVFPYVARLEVPQGAAQTLVETDRPTFYFYFEPADEKVSDFGMAATRAAQSPAEFSLVRLRPVEGRREMTLGKVSRFNADIGVDPRNAIAFAADEIGDGIFRVDVTAPLSAGEYAFVLKSTKGYRLYDFHVAGGAAP